MSMSISAGRARLQDTSPFDIVPLGAKFGAEVHGLDLTQPLSPQSFAAFEAALIEHKVLVVRDQDLTSEQHLSISRRFGTLEVHPMRPQGAAPELLVLDNHKDNPVLSTDVWHSDTTFRRNPTKYTILRCQIMPKAGGDTLWTDMEAAYEGLSPTLRKMIDGLRAVHDFQNFRVLFKNTDEDIARLRRMEEMFPNPSHPVVRTHPVSGRKCIFVNPQFTIRIEGLHPDESRAMLDLLFQKTHVPEYQFRLQWSPGAIVFWDNQSTQHYAANDYYPERRRMERTAIVGDVPF